MNPFLSLTSMWLPWLILGACLLLMAAVGIIPLKWLGPFTHDWLKGMGVIMGGIWDHKLILFQWTCFVLAIVTVAVVMVLIPFWTSVALVVLVLVVWIPWMVVN